MVRLPKISHKSTSTTSSITKSNISLQDQITAKSWLYVTNNSQLGILFYLLKIYDLQKIIKFIKAFVVILKDKLPV